MRLSDAIETGEVNTADLKELSLHRYGFIGSLDDANAVVVWLRDHPLVDVEWMPPDAPPVTETTRAGFGPQSTVLMPLAASRRVWLTHWPVGVG